MAHELDDIEKEEAVKEWLRKNVPVIIIGVFGGLLAVFGWNHYQTGQFEQRGQAAAIYQNIMESEDPAQRRADAQRLRDDYAATPYAAIGALEMARQLVNDDQDLAAAAEKFRWVIDNARESSLVNLAAVRLARVQLSMDQPDEALATLDRIGSPEGFSGLIAHVRGDVYLRRGEREQARQAFQEALLADGQGGMTRGLIEMKLSELGADAS